MVDIDIDKMLEDSEEREHKAEGKNKTKLFAIIGAVSIFVIIVGIVIALKTIGEKSVKYMPLETGVKITYNIKGASPEVWKVKDEMKTVRGYECKVLNKENQASNLSKQEYYHTGKDGIVRLAYSKNYGKIKNFPLGVLPARAKKGKTFTAGKIYKVVINATIEDKEVLSTPIGEYKTLRVSYKAGKYMDKVVWFAQGVGIVKEVDKVADRETFIIGLEDK